MTIVDSRHALTSRRLRQGLPDLLALGREPLTISLRDVRTANPDGLVSMLSLVDHVRSSGQLVTVEGPSEASVGEALARAGLAVALSELTATHDLPLLEPWRGSIAYGAQRFSSYDVLDEIALDILEWCTDRSSAAADIVWGVVCEAGQNVLQHSGSDHGYVALDYHAAQGFRFAVSDSGVGFRLALGRADTPTDVGALRLALQDGVSDSPDLGRGRGLPWMANRASDGNGELVVVSGGAAAVVAQDRGSAEDPDVRKLPTSLPGALVRGVVPLYAEGTLSRSGVA